MSVVTVCRTPLDQTWKIAYIWMLFVAFFVVPCTVMSVVYPLVCRQLMKNDIAIPQRAGNKPRQCQESRQYLSSKDSSSCSTYRHDQDRVYVNIQENRQKARKRAVSRKPSRAHTLRHQVIYMVITIFVYSFLCLFPLRVFLLWSVYSDDTEKAKLGPEAYLGLMSFCRIMYYLNSAGNPILYNLVSSKFRQACRKCLLYVCRRGRPLHLDLSTTQDCPVNHTNGR